MSDEEALTKQPPPRQVEVALGGGVTLECGTEGLTTGVPNCWGRVMANQRVETIGAGPQLRLDSVLYQEAGNYRCVAPATPDPLLVQRKALLNEPDIKLVVTGKDNNSGWMFLSLPECLEMASFCTAEKVNFQTCKVFCRSSKNT